MGYVQRMDYDLFPNDSIAYSEGLRPLGNGRDAEQVVSRIFTLFDRLFEFRPASSETRLFGSLCPSLVWVVSDEWGVSILPS